MDLVAIVPVVPGGAAFVTRLALGIRLSLANTECNISATYTSAIYRAIYGWCRYISQNSSYKDILKPG